MIRFGIPNRFGALSEILVRLRMRRVPGSPLGLGTSTSRGDFASGVDAETADTEAWATACRYRWFTDDLQGVFLIWRNQPFAASPVHPTPASPALTAPIQLAAPADCSATSKNREASSSIPTFPQTHRRLPDMDCQTAPAIERARCGDRDQTRPSERYCGWAPIM